jgi:hypothetical protein
MLEDLLEKPKGLGRPTFFNAFQLQVAKIYNNNLRKLKEDSVRAMIHKMILQVCKHNKRYLLSSKLVRGIFAEQPTGQAIVQLLRHQENLPPLQHKGLLPKSTHVKSMW